MLQLLIAGLMGLSVTLIFTGLALRRQPDEVAARLDRSGARAVPEALRELELPAPFSHRALQPLLLSISQLVARFTPARTIESTRHNLELAGRPNNWTVADFL